MAENCKKIEKSFFNSKTYWSNEMTLEFLYLYKSEPCLWNPKHKYHKHRPASIEAWNRIMSSFSVDLTVDDFKKKKETLMATFRSLYAKKVKTSNRYKPSWFVFNVMEEFLKEVYDPKRKQNSNVESDCNYDEEDETVIESDDFNQNNCEEGEVPDNHDKTEALFKTSFSESAIFQPTPDKTYGEKRKMIDEEVAYEDLEIPSMSSVHSVTTPKLLAIKNKRRKENETIKDMVKDACNVIKDMNEVPRRDICSLYTELLTIRLKAFDELTRDILMNEIDNLVFKTKMEQQKQKLVNTEHTAPHN